MKIVLLQDVLRSGGTERQSILLAHGFHARGHDTRLITFRPGGALQDTVEGVEHRALQPFDFGWDWFAPALTVRLRREEPDVVLAMGRMANCLLGGVTGALHRRTPEPGIAVATFRTGRSVPWLFRRSLRRADQVVANSEEAAATVRGIAGVAGERVSVIHNSLVFAPDVPEAERLARRDELRARFGARPGTFVLACVAMFRPEKNQRELLEIAAELPEDLDWQLWLAGDGPARAGCVARARELGLEPRVKFPGFMTDPAPLYAGADAAVHASRSEALSNFLIEAQAHGLPAVAYRAQGIAECLIPERTGWVIPPGDRPAFRTALIRLARMAAADRGERAREAAAFARERFDPARQVEAYLTLFGRLLGRRA